MERWTPVVDKSGRLMVAYEVSDQGRVRSYLKVGGTGGYQSRSRPKATFIGRGGFHCVTLQRGNGRCFVYLVQQLVAIAFVGRPRGRRHVIVHLNHDVNDNRAYNLAWVTRAAASCHSLSARPRRGIHAKFTVAKVRAIRRSNRPVKELAAKYGVTVQSVYAVKKRHTWKDVE